MKVLFVCTGNITRSFTAEYVLKKEFETHFPDWEVKSCGIRASPCDPYGRLQKHVEGYYGQSIEHHSQQISTELIAWADEIICFTHEHVAAVKEMGGDGKLFNMVVKGVDEDFFDDVEYGRKHGSFDLDAFLDQLFKDISEGVEIWFDQFLDH